MHRPPLLVLLLLVGFSVQAQELPKPLPRQGYFLSVGLHGAAALVRDEGDWQFPWSGGFFGLRMGELLTPALGLGLVLEGGPLSGPDLSGSGFSLGLEGQWEFLPRLIARGGFGLGVLAVADTDEDGKRLLRGSVGTRYYLALARDCFPGWEGTSGGLGLTPVLRLDAFPGDAIRSLSLFLGLELTYFTGLPRNQLELPHEEAYKPGGNERD